MKPYKIILFTFAVFSVLTVICTLFPRDGLQIGGLTLHFPSLSEVLQPTTASESVAAETLMQQTMTSLEQMRQREQELQQNAERDRREAEFLRFFHENATRIYLPDDKNDYFDRFFAALDSAQKHPIRVLHYGDSQIEEDRISGVLREAMQTRFGGNGPGLLPIVQTVPSTAIVQQCSNAMVPRYLVYGNTTSKISSRRYGVMGQMTQLDGTLTLSFSVRNWKETGRHCKHFSRLKLLLGNVERTVTTTLKTNGTTLPEQTIATNAGTHILTFNLPQGSQQVDLTLNGRAELYGIMLDGNNGIAWDNIPMRGCSGTIFTGINSAMPTHFCKSENVRLVVMQFGGNIVPYVKNEQALTNYRTRMASQIQRIHTWAPNAKILFIGPADMSTSIDGQMQTYPFLPHIVEGLKTTALENDAAFWDLYAAMGGKNSMIKWVRSNPPMAASDYIHFAHNGACKVADLLQQSLMIYYDYYKLRTDSVVHTLTPLALPKVQSVPLILPKQPIFVPNHTSKN